LLLGAIANHIDLQDSVCTGWPFAPRDWQDFDAASELGELQSAQFLGDLGGNRPLGVVKLNVKVQGIRKLASGRYILAACMNWSPEGKHVGLVVGVQDTLGVPCPIS
jgi:hypothetical protein